MAVNPNTDFVAGAILTASQQNRFGRGAMGYVSKSDGNFAAITAETDLTGMSITFTGVTGRLYRLSTGIVGLKNTNAGYIFITAKDASNAIIGQNGSNAVAGGYADVAGTYLFTAVGATTIRLTAQAENASVTIQANSAIKCTMIIEDVGFA